MHRFFFPFDKIHQDKITLSDAKECHHIKNVLRLRPGAEIILFNGAGLQARAIIEKMDEDKILLEFRAVEEKKIRLPELILACAIPKKSKFELIIEKATELGVSQIFPLQTKRTIVKFKKEQMASKISRFNKIALAAAKQCQRADLPLIHPVTAFKEAVDHLSVTSTAVIPSLEEKKVSLKNVLGDIQSATAVSFFIGPEGDFAPEEYAYARQKGCVAVSLGENILRVETAALAVLSAASVYFHQ